MTGDTLVLNADMMPVSILPLSSMMWQDAVKAIWINSVAVIDYYDDWVVHSPSMEMKVPAVVMTRQYISLGRGVGFSPENVFLRDRYRCQYCGDRFAESKLTMDHVHPRTFGGRTTWDNITTSCSPCNNRRGHNVKIQPMEMPYRPSYYEMVERRREFPIEVPHEKWAEYLQWGDNVVVKNRRRKAPPALTLVQKAA